MTRAPFRRSKPPFGQPSLAQMAARLKALEELVRQLLEQKKP